MDTLLRAILAAPAADTLGGDEELVVVENTQIKRKPVSQALEDMRVARFNATGPVIPDRIGTQRYMPYILAQSGVPVGIAPNATIATNGTLTIPGGSALPTTYSGGIWLRFPASAVVGDSTGGIYWCVMSSTTSGTVYAGKIDAASAFTPYIGSTAGVAVTGSNSAYTQDTAADITLANITMPAGAMGTYGMLAVREIFALCNNSASSKWIKVKVASTTIMNGVGGSAMTTNTAGRGVAFFRNCGNAALNMSNQWLAFGQSNSTAWSTIDTSASVTLTLTGQLATVATDFLILNGFTVEVLPS